MSIVRVGLAETKNFSDGYDAIFGKKKSGDAKSETGSAAKPKKAKPPVKKGKKK